MLNLRLVSDEPVNHRLERMISDRLLQVLQSSFRCLDGTCYKEADYCLLCRELGDYFGRESASLTDSFLSLCASLDSGAYEKITKRQKGLLKDILEAYIDYAEITGNETCEEFENAADILKCIRESRLLNRRGEWKAPGFYNSRREKDNDVQILLFLSDIRNYDRLLAS